MYVLFYKNLHEFDLNIFFVYKIESNVDIRGASLYKWMSILQGKLVFNLLFCT